MSLLSSLFTVNFFLAFAYISLFNSNAVKDVTTVHKSLTQVIYRSPDPLYIGSFVRYLNNIFIIA